MKFSFFLLLAYLFGSVPFGFLIGKTIRGIDIREHGSKNIGATNVFRVIGKKWGITVFVLDAFKGLFSVMLPTWLGIEYAPPQNIIIGIAAILGHSFPVWLSFKGGKGVATSFGVFLGLSFAPCILSFIIFCLVFALSHILSLGSLSAALSFPFFVWLLYRKIVGFPWYFSISLLLCLFIFYTHRQNISRLIRKEEKKLF